MNHILKIILISIPILFSGNLSAQSLLTDRNGDGLVTVVGFGDSISFGLGDLEQPGEEVIEPVLPNNSFGYLLRVRTAGFNTVNRAVPGQFFTIEGISSFASIAGSSGADVIGILAGTNDAGLLVSSGEYARNMQKAINIARTLNVEPVLFTVLPTCCIREGRTIVTAEYSSVIRQLAIANNVALADITRAWNNTCNVITPPDDLEDGECPLLNIPDGLHPNNMGHDLISHTFLATMYDINIFGSAGSAALESVAGLESGSVFIVPDQEASSGDSVEVSE